MSGRRSRRPGVALAVAAGVVLLLAVLAAVGAWWLLFRPATDVAPGKPIQVEIPAGSSTTQIARLLATAGVIENENMFRVQTRLEKADGKMRAGVYELATGMPYDLVIERMVAGPAVKYVTVTIPEGFVAEQIASRLEKQAGIPSREFLSLARGGAQEFADEHSYLEGAYENKLEGYLFPKTYRIREDATARDVIEMMLDQFDKEIAEVDTGAAERKGRSLQDLVVIASIIERETKAAEERPLVASVVENRLAADMRLEMCATVEYVLPGNRLRLTNEDLRIDSPYNTYRHKGLPPGPISNPGLASLKAAANPAHTDYIFYVLTGKDGTHTFASNNRDFLKAKAKSKEVFGQ